MDTIVSAVRENGELMGGNKNTFGRRSSELIVRNRVHKRHRVNGKDLIIREARIEDAPAVQSLFNEIYQGRYPLEFGTNIKILEAELIDDDRHLWIVTEDPASKRLIGALMFNIDGQNRMAKAGGAVVVADYRKFGLGSMMLKLGMRYLTENSKQVDAIYTTSRTVSEGPARIVTEAGFHQLGFFPNAVQIEEMEHLNLDVFLTKRALASRRAEPYLLAPFYEIYKIARKQLKLEKAHLVTQRQPLQLSGKKIQFDVIDDRMEVIKKFRVYSEQNRIFNAFFPFHTPNQLFRTADQASEVFVWYGGLGKQAYLMGFRTDQVHIHDLLDSVALALQKSGAAYVELLVDAYDYMTQQEAYTAKFIPSAYFPGMHLARDGKRDDFFVLSRTFQILDFTHSCVTPENYPYLKAYMKFYDELFIQPIRRADIRRREPKTLSSVSERA